MVRQTTAGRGATAKSGLARYVEHIQRVPLLDQQQEYALAKRWREHGDRHAQHTLITSHLRLVVKIAFSYRRYGLPVADLVAEGNLGLIKAVDRFEPDRGFRLATYARWWIRASIQEHLLRSWSLVKMGTTEAQKKLFFKLRQVKVQLQALEDGDLTPEHVAAIAHRLGVREDDVIAMNRRLGGDASLNTPASAEFGSGEWQDWLVDATPTQEERLADAEELERRRAFLSTALATLSARERRIFEARQLAEEPITLHDLSAEFGVSRERIRQIEQRALEKLRTAPHHFRPQVAGVRSPCRGNSSRGCKPEGTQARPPTRAQSR
jgi:RNA polymerase sigma-32 factor